MHFRQTRQPCVCTRLLHILINSLDRTGDVSDYDTHKVGSVYQYINSLHGSTFKHLLVAGDKQIFIDLLSIIVKLCIIPNHRLRPAYIIHTVKTSIYTFIYYLPFSNFVPFPALHSTIYNAAKRIIFGIMLQKWALFT